MKIGVFRWVEVSNRYRIMAGSCLLAAVQVRAARLTYESIPTRASLDYETAQSRRARNP